MLTDTTVDGVNTYETRVSLVPQPLCLAQLLGSGCTALSGGASAVGDQQAAAVTLLPAAGFQSTLVVSGLEKKTEIVAVHGPSES